MDVCVTMVRQRFEPLTSPLAAVYTYQLLALRAEAIEKRLQGDAPDLNDPIERVKDHCDRVGALSVRFKVRNGVDLTPAADSPCRARYPASFVPKKIDPEKRATYLQGPIVS